MIHLHKLWTDCLSSARESWKACLFLIPTLFAFMACSSDDIVLATQGEVTTATKGQVMTFAPKEVGFNTDFAPAEKKDSAATRGVRLTVGDMGLPSIQLTTDDGDTSFPVLVMLYKEGANPSFSETSLSIIKKTVEINGKQQTITRLKFPNNNLVFSPGPAEREGNWRLYAFYGYDQWDAANKQLHYNKKMIALNRFLKKEDVITLGKDLKIPFTLRESDDANAAMGAPISIAVNEAGQWVLNIEGAPYFKPEGSLYNMKFWNGMNSVSLNNLNLPYPNSTSSAPKFDFRIDHIYIESTHSAAEGYYDLAHNLPTVGTRKGFAWKNAKVGVPIDGDKAAYVTGGETEVSAQSPYKYRVDLATPASFNSGEETGYFYFWMYDPAYNLDSQDNTFANPDEGLAVRLDIFNKTLNLRQTPAMVYSSRKKHKSGNLYRIKPELSTVLMPNALDWMGNQLDEINGTYYWADPYRQNNTETNAKGEPGSGDFFKFASNSSLQISNLLKKTFSVKDYYSPNAPVHQWYIPDEATVKSVFPFINGNAELEKITTAFDRPADYMVGPVTESVKIAGIPFNNVKSYYYRKDKSNWEDRAYQFGDGSDNFKVKNGPYAGTIQRDSRNIVYAIRFAGTPYCTAFMYMEKGKWYNAEITTDPYRYYNPSDKSEYSKLRIYAKHLGLLYGFDGQYDEQKLKDYLKNVVARNDFWGSDVFADDPWPEVTRRVLSPNGAYQDYKGGLGYVGREFNLWLSEDNGNAASIYRIVEADGKDSYWKSKNSNSEFLFKTKYKSNVVPWLDPTQFAK